MDNATDVVLGQRLEEDRFIQSVQELRTEVCTQVIHDCRFCLRLDRTVLVDAVQQIACTDVGSHDQDGILEVNRTSLGIGDTTVIQYLQQYVKHIGMCFFDFIEQYHTVRFSPHGFGQLTALFVSYVSGRRSDQTRDRILLHVLTHIDTHHVVLIVEQRCRQALRQLRLTDTGRSQEQERTDGLTGILDTGFGTNDSFGDLGHAFILSYHTFVQFFIQVKGLVTLALGQFGYGNTGPAGDNPGNFFFRYFFVYQ